MKKTPLFYKNQVVGYIDDIQYNNEIIETIKIYFFCNFYFDEIIGNIKKSIYSTLNDNKYDFEIKEDILICKLKRN